MTSIEFTHLVAALAAGIGMLLVGASSLLLRRTHWQVVASLLVAGSVAAVVWACSGDPTISVAAAGTLLVALIVVTGSGHLASFAAMLARTLREPAVRWGLLACAGLLTAIGSIVAYEQAEHVRNERLAAELAEISAVPPCQVSTAALVLTDRGNPVEIREATDPRPAHELAGLEDRVLNREPIRNQVLRRQPADDRSNCHGWVFSGGRFWIGGLSVDPILRDNGYQVVDEPQPGDLAVFRDSEGKINHTALVRYRSPGMPVMVESKWGCIGVYLHPVEISVYGTNFTYYRSPRPGHLLAGLGGPSPDPLSNRPR